MADTDNNQSQANNNPSNNQPSQQSDTQTPQPVEQPSIPSTPDQSLASNMNKGLNNETVIPAKPDPTLTSSKTANEEGLKTIK